MDKRMKNEGSHPIVPAHLAVKAMRDNGYKNTAYALAELMDNAIQAKAKTVELLCHEQTIQLEQRARSVINQVAVLDDGHGMTAEKLRVALQFGNGEHLEYENQRGIGKFGMGLPASSISQCRRVDVWTWQNGVDSAIHTYLDIDEITGRKMLEVPPPDKMTIPEVWLKVGSSFGKSGTLVVWSNLDRCLWRTASAIISNSEFVIGRMYRRFLAQNKVTIRMVSFNSSDIQKSLQEKQAQPNDPLYLIPKTSCPEPYNNEAMFQLWGNVVPKKIEFRGETHEVKIRFSYAKEEARKGHNPGERPYGRHAAKNVGVSVVRADRELELDDTWTIKYNPVERWWGVEIEFPPALDEIFGVTNNKQHAHNFSELANFDIESLLSGGKTISQLKEEMFIDHDPRGPLIEIAHEIQKNLGTLRGLLSAQTKGSRRAARHRTDDAEKKATEATKKRQEEGYKGKSDEDESRPDQERQAEIEKDLVDAGLPKDAANTLSSRLISDGLKYIFAEAELETPAFFSVKPKAGALIITLNTKHPAYSKLVEILEHDTSGEDIETLRERLVNSLEGLKLLLSAWARYEDELPDGPRKERAQEVRSDWGRIARQFMSFEE